MLPCSEVTRLIASEALRQAPIHRRLAVRLHLMMCDHCRRYARELRRLGAAIREEFRGLVPQRAELERLEATVRARLRAEVQGPDRPPPA
jgi:anti-sigma factor RsiW